MSKASALKHIASLGAPAGAGALLGLESQDANAGFYGLSAKMADDMMLNIARKMQSEGHTPTEIWQKTRWFQDPVDKNWKFEVDDTEADWHPDIVENGYVKQYTTGTGANKRQLSTPLFGAFVNDNLLYNYPQLASYHFTPMPSDTPFGKKGEHYISGKEIRTNPNLLAENQRSTMLHEMQHAVQSAEGWQNGSAPKNFSDQYSKDLKREWAQAYSKSEQMVDAIKQFENTLKSDPDNEAVKKALQYFRKRKIEHDEIISDLEHRIPKSSPHDQYEAMAGEVEARNVQSRDNARRQGFSIGLAPPSTASHSPGETIRSHADSPAWKGHQRKTIENPKSAAGIAAVTGLSSNAQASLDALKYGEIKAPKHPRLAKASELLHDFSDRASGSVASLLAPDALAAWLSKVSYNEHPTNLERAMAILDVGPVTIPLSKFKGALNILKHAADPTDDPVGEIFQRLVERESTEFGEFSPHDWL